MTTWDFATRNRIANKDSVLGSPGTNGSTDLGQFIVESLFVGPRSIYLDSVFKKISREEISTIIAYTNRASSNRKAITKRRVYVWCLLSPVWIDMDVISKEDLNTKFSCYEDFVDFLFVNRYILVCQVKKIKEAFHRRYYEKQQGSA